MKSVLITTQHRGVFYGEVNGETDLKETVLTDIKNARMAIYFGTTKGVMELADTGPTSSSRIGAAADIDVLHDVTGVFSVTDKAKKKWLTA